MKPKTTVKSISVKLLPLILAAVMLTAVFGAPSVSAASPEDYEASLASQNEYYYNVYVPAYYAYNDALDALASRIVAADFETYDQAKRVIDFLGSLKGRRGEFFGDRTTQGKSRYVVPALRETMFDYASARDWDNAVNYCGQLVDAVKQRVGFLSGLKAEIEGFRVILTNDPEIPSALSASFTLIKINANSYQYTLVINNPTEEDVIGWKFSFKYDASVTNLHSAENTTGALNVTGLNTGNIIVQPKNSNQECNKIRAGGSVSFGGNCSAGSEITEAYLNGEAVSVTFSVSELN